MYLFFGKWGTRRLGWIWINADFPLRRHTLMSPCLIFDELLDSKQRSYA